jgi:hypothetical protein
LLLTASLVPCSTNAQVPAYVPTNGLVGWWPFNGNAQDESGNGNNGTVNGATLTADRFGNVDEAYSFDGINNWIEIANNSSYSFLLNNSYTLNFWFNINHTTNTMSFIGQGDGDGQYQNKFWRSYLSQDAITNHIRGDLSDPNDTKNNYLNFSNSTWHMLTMVRSYNNTLKLFIDGIEVDTDTDVTGVASPFSATRNIIIGAFLNAYNGQLMEYLEGKLDDIGIWNRALTQEEVTALYTSCANSIITQPSTMEVALSTGNTAQFAVATNATSPIYQWQGNSGMGFLNLSDAGQYSGSATNTLSVNNVTISNHNHQFRCIVTDGSCADTTDIAVLTVIDDLGIEDLQPNASKNLVKITDLNGKETAFRKNTVLLFIYDDGSVERVFEVE